MTYIFDKELLKAWEHEKDTKYAIPDPGDNLIEIYEIDTIKDALQLRAEKWESPEHKYEPPTSSVTAVNEVKKPLNVQNPNYTELLENIRALQKQSGDLKKNKKDLKGLKENKDKVPDLVAINKKETLIGEIDQKLQKSWKKLVDFITKVCLFMDPSLTTLTIQISKLEFVPDIRLIRYMLQKREPKIDMEIITLICSYLHAKYC